MASVYLNNEIVCPQCHELVKNGYVLEPNEGDTLANTKTTIKCAECGHGIVINVRLEWSYHPSNYKSKLKTHKVASLELHHANTTIHGRR